jgi:lipopolysaccharide export system permease protein
MGYGHEDHPPPDLQRRAAVGGLHRAGLPAAVLFFDLVDQLGDLRDLATRGYSLAYALLYVALQMPGHLYDLLPIAVLIGTIFVMARLAESSQYTILRTSGLGPLRALGTLLLLGLGFVVLTFAIGDYVTPAANRAATAMQARFRATSPWAAPAPG